MLGNNFLDDSFEEEEIYLEESNSIEPESSSYEQFDDLKLFKKYQKIIDSYRLNSDEIICDKCFYTPIISLKLNEKDYIIEWNCECGNSKYSLTEFYQKINCPLFKAKCSKCSINYNYGKLTKCVKCNLILCDSCYKKHKKDIIHPIQTTHPSIDLSNICNKCKFHPKPKVCGYCVICKENICRKCIESHKIHNIINFEEFKITKKEYDIIFEKYIKRKNHFFRIFSTREKLYKNFKQQLEKLLKDLNESFEKFKENNFSVLGFYETILDSKENFFENFYYEKQINLLNLKSIKIVSPLQSIYYRDTITSINDYISKLRNIIKDNNQQLITKYPHSYELNNNYSLLPLKDGNLVCFNNHSLKIIKGKPDFSDLFIFPNQTKLIDVFQLPNEKILTFKYNNQYSFEMKMFSKSNNSNIYKEEVTFFDLEKIEDHYDNLFLFRQNFQIIIKEIQDYKLSDKSFFNLLENNLNKCSIIKLCFINKNNFISFLTDNTYKVSMIILYNINLGKEQRRFLFDYRYFNLYHLKESNIIIIDNIIFNLLTWQIQTNLNYSCIGILNNGNLILQNDNQIIVYDENNFNTLLKFQDKNYKDLTDIFLLNGLIIYKRKYNSKIYYIKYSPKKMQTFTK